MLLKWNETAYDKMKENKGGETKMKNTRKVLCFVMVFAMVLVVAVPVLANENPGISPQSSSDIPFQFEFTTLIGTHVDDTEPSHMGYKDNDSSVYVNVMQFPGSFYIYTNAYVNGQRHDCTQRDALVTRSGEWLVYNLIYETYGRVKTGLGGVRAQGGNVSGKWSPDYTYYPGDNIPHVNP